jgi:hypothetical protein
VKSKPECEHSSFDPCLLSSAPIETSPPLLVVACVMEKGMHCQRDVWSPIADSLWPTYLCFCAPSSSIAATYHSFLHVGYSALNSPEELGRTNSLSATRLVESVLFYLPLSSSILLMPTEAKIIILRPPPVHFYSFTFQRNSSTSARPFPVASAVWGPHEKCAGRAI